MQNLIEAEAREYEESAYSSGYANGYEAAQGGAAYALEYARHARTVDSSNYARGYCDGFNAYAVDCGATEPTDREIVKQLRRESDAARAAQRQQDAAERAERARESAALRLAFLRKNDPRSAERARLEAELT